MSLMAFFFVLSFFPRDVFDEIWDLIESVSEGFLSYYFKWEAIYCKIYKNVNGLPVNQTMGNWFFRLWVK